MRKTILIAGLAVALSAGAVAAQTPAPSPAPRAAPGVAPPGPGPRDPGLGFGRGGGFGGPGMRGPGMRRRMGPPPTPEQVQQRNAALFARMDVNRDGRVTFDEFRQEAERRRLERQRQMFQRFSGEQDSVTLDQLNARSLARLNDRARGRDGGRLPGPPVAPPAR